MGVINDFIPMKIDQTVGNTPRQVITAERWNELFNLNITQGDHSETWLQNLVDAHNTLITDTNAALALKSDKAVTNQHYKTVTFNANTGIFTFTREDGSFTTIDTALEKVATNWQYDPATQELVLTLADGSTQRVSLSAFITENEFVDSSTVVFSVSNHKVTAGVKPGSLNDTHLTSAFVASLQNYVTQAQASATAAANSATDAAASAALASNRATAASGSATSAATSKDAAATYSTNASNAATAASGSATAASGSAGAASSSAAKSESWTVGGTGTRPGEDTNNAKYWAGKAEQIVGGGFLPIDGSGTMTGDLHMGEHNIEDVRSVFIKYYDASYADDGIRLTANTANELLLSAHEGGPCVLSGLSAPVRVNDAANKKYADKIHPVYLGTDLDNAWDNSPLVNQLAESGYYYIVETEEQFQTVVLHIERPNGSATQLVFPGEEANIVYTRCRTNGVWTTPYALATEWAINDVVQRHLAYNTSVLIAHWVADTTYSTQGYNWRASIQNSGIDTYYKPDVAFPMWAALSGNFAPIAESYNGGIYIYAKEKPTTNITVGVSADRT